jgi:hypothetical protein
MKRSTLVCFYDVPPLPGAICCFERCMRVRQVDIESKITEQKLMEISPG